MTGGDEILKRQWNKYGQLECEEFDKSAIPVTLSFKEAVSKLDRDYKAEFQFGKQLVEVGKGHPTYNDYLQVYLR